MRLILASASPRRADLLRAAGFAFETHAAEVDERVHPGETPADYVMRLAAEKAARASEALSSPDTDALVVLAADTAVIVDDIVLGKPDGDENAQRMLRRLSGRSHEVMTGLCLRAAAAELKEIETTTVWFTGLSAAEIDWYVASGEGSDKAGGYAIQGLASRFVPRIEGSYSNVVGLPIARVWAMLKIMGLARPQGSRLS
jgi:septum formation protein